MFTGIVECTGTVVAIEDWPGGKRLQIDMASAGEGLKHGDSVSVNGVCLTVVTAEGNCCWFDVITETLSKTNLGQLKVGGKVNLERSLRAGGRIDGHFVQGHVHGLGYVVERIVTEKEFKLWIRPDEQLKLYIVPLGSVAVNGVSMTVAEVRPDAFAMALIPTTLERTNLGELRVGDPVNIETDLLSRQIVHYLQCLGLDELVEHLRTRPVQDSPQES